MIAITRSASGAISLSPVRSPCVVVVDGRAAPDEGGNSRSQIRHRVTELGYEIEGRNVVRIALEDHVDDLNPPVRRFLLGGQDPATPLTVFNLLAASVTS